MCILALASSHHGRHRLNSVPQRRDEAALQAFQLHGTAIETMNVFRLPSGR